MQFQHPFDEPMRIDPDDDPLLEKLPVCEHCGQSIYEHNKDSEPPWMCPYEYQREPIYGYFGGGDPRDFHPDHECCSPEEIKRHKEACEAADKLAKDRNLPCPSGWERLPDGRAAHVTRAPFGIGMTCPPPTCYQARFDF
jgi:hypothetical protein